MAYFLGIQTSEGLKPLKIYDRAGNLIPNSILNLVAFTSSFNDSFELLEYLQEKGNIKDYQGRFFYLIDKGQKGNKTYSIVPGTETIVYADDKNNFIPSLVRKKLHYKAFNTDFIEHLYAFYLKKYGMFNKSITYFKQLGGQPYELREVLSSLLKYPISDQSRKYLYELLDILNVAIVRGSKRFFEGDEARRFYDLLDQVDSYFSQLDKDIILFCKVFSSKIKSNSISALNNLGAIYRLVCSGNTSIGEYWPDSDRDDLDYYIDHFLDFTIYNYDKKLGSFKRENGKRKLQERNLFDLGVFLSDYDRFENYLYQSMLPTSSEQIDNESEHEEFLEEEDFLRINTTSEEQGITLRMTDDKINSNKLW